MMEKNTTRFLIGGLMPLGLAACSGNSNPTPPPPLYLGQTVVISGIAADYFGGTGSIKAKTVKDGVSMSVVIASGSIATTGNFSITLPAANALASVLAPFWIDSDACNKTLTVTPANLKGAAVIGSSFEVFDQKQNFIGAITRFKQQNSSDYRSTTQVGYLYLDQDGGFRGACPALPGSDDFDLRADVSGKAGWNLVLLEFTSIAGVTPRLKITSSAIPNDLRWTFQPLGGPNLANTISTFNTTPSLFIAGLMR
jgi:hypothetical protein